MKVFNKARELAEAIQASEESCRLADARSLVKEGTVSEQELQAAIKDYNALVDEAIGIVNMSIGTHDGGCGSGCGCGNKGGCG